jgi:hypothetical protein
MCNETKHFVVDKVVPLHGIRKGTPIGVPFILLLAGEGAISLARASFSYRGLMFAVQRAELLWLLMMKPT